MLTDYKVYAVLPSSDLAVAKTWFEEKTGTTPSKRIQAGCGISVTTAPGSS